MIKKIFYFIITLLLILSSHSNEKELPKVLNSENMRTATLQDSISIAAEKAFEEGENLEKKGDAESLKKAQQKYTESLQLWQNIDNIEMIIATLHRLGEISFKTSDYPGMQIYYYRALRHSRQQKDVNGVAVALYKIGVARMNKNEAFEALDVLDQALELSKQIKDRILEADILDAFGQIYEELDDYAKGVEYAQKSLAIRRELGDEKNIAKSLQVLAQTLDNLGENQKAHDYYQEALQYARKVGQRSTEAILIGQIGHIYYQFGEYQTSLDYYQQCLDISTEIGNRHGQAWALKMMADISRFLGDYESAIHNYSISLDICRQMGVRVGIGANLANLAVVYTQLDSTDKALELLNEALVMQRQINDREAAGSILIKIGDVYVRSGNAMKASEYYKAALSTARTLQDPRLLERANFALGRQERRAGNARTAREHIEIAIQLADSMRSSVLNQNLRTTYFDSINSYYDELMLLFMQQNGQDPNADYDRLAFQTSENSRGRSLLEMLNEGQVDLRAGLDPGLLEGERLVKQKLNAKAQQRQRMIKGDPDPDKLTSLEAEIRTLLTEYEDIETRIRQEQPRLAAIEKADALSFEKIQSEVIDESTLLIEYALIDERSFAWVVTSDSLICFELPPAAEIDSTARLVYQSLTARNISQKDESTAQRHERIQTSDEQLYAAMSDLSKNILSPLAGHLNKPRLVFVCDEILQYIPFGALPMPDDGNKKNNAYDPLVNHFEILSVPSASALPLIRQDKQRASRPDKLIAMFADPVFSADDPRLSLPVTAQQDSSEPIVYAHLDKALQETGVGTRSDLSRLPFSRREANDIISLAGRENCSCFLDFEASYSTAVSPDLSNFNIIHFATHGMMNNMHTELSGLVLSLYDQQGKPQNGFLRLHDIYQLDLNADLVVLSACQTALGKDIRGEGLIGLTRGFMYAGAPRVVASLWKVDDEATAELMKRFYQYMLGEEQLPAAAALRKAQISIMSEKRWQSPYYWAGFILQGDWQ